MDVFDRWWQIIYQNVGECDNRKLLVSPQTKYKHILNPHQGRQYTCYFCPTGTCVTWQQTKKHYGWRKFQMQKAEENQPEEK